MRCIYSLKHFRNYIFNFNSIYYLGREFFAKVAEFITCIFVKDISTFVGEIKVLQYHFVNSFVFTSISYDYQFSAFRRFFLNLLKSFLKSKGLLYLSILEVVAGQKISMVSNRATFITHFASYSS